MNAMQTTRKPAPLTHGTCRLIPACDLPLPAALDAGEALLAILPERGEPTSYTVQRLQGDDGRTLGYRLTRLAAYLVDRKVYDIDMSQWYGWTCDCPDSQFRGGECKHVRALRAALTKAGIPTPTAPKPVPTPAPSTVEFDDP